MKIKLKKQYEGVLVESVSALDEKTIKLIYEHSPDVINEFYTIEL